MSSQLNNEPLSQLDICCRQAAKKFGKPDVNIWTNRDYLFFSNDVFKQTDVQISPSTLKRIFGKWKTKERYYPQKATLDALAQYAGYKNWNEFEAKTLFAKTHSNIPSSDSQTEVIVNEKREVNPLEQPDNKKSIRIRIIIASILFVLVAATSLILMQKTDDTLSPGTVNLVCNKPTGEAPHSATFSISLKKNFDGDIKEFTLDFGDGQQEQHLLPDNQKTYYYKIPGRYFAVLKYKGTPCDTVPVYLTTKGWTAFASMPQDTLWVYPVATNDLNIKNGLHVNASQIKAAGIDTAHTFFVEFINTIPLNINADNFELTTRLATSKPRPGVRCSQVDIMIYGEKSRHMSIFIKPGCVNWSTLQFSEVFKDGRLNDLGFLGCDLTNGGLIRMRVKNKNAEIFINEKLAFTGNYTEPMQKVYGIKISFAGIGTVYSLNLKDLNTGEVFEGNF